MQTSFGQDYLDIIPADLSLWEIARSHVLIICRTLRKSNKNFDVFNNKNFQKELYLWYVKISLFLHILGMFYLKPF